MYKNIIAALLVLTTSQSLAFYHEPDITYNNSSIGKSYKEQLGQFSLIHSQLVSAETNILSRNTIDRELKVEIEEYKKRLNLLNESYKQIKDSSDYDVGKMIVAKTVYAPRCKSSEVEFPIPSVIIYECSSLTKKREMFFGGVVKNDFRVTSYKSGYLEDFSSEVKGFMSVLGRFKTKPITSNRIYRS